MKSRAVWSARLGTPAIGPAFFALRIRWGGGRGRWLRRLSVVESRRSKPESSVTEIGGWGNAADLRTEIRATGSYRKGLRPLLGPLLGPFGPVSISEGALWPLLRAQSHADEGPGNQPRQGRLSRAHESRLTFHDPAKPRSGALILARRAKPGNLTNPTKMNPSKLEWTAQRLDRLTTFPLIRPDSWLVNNRLAAAILRRSPRSQWACMTPARECEVLFRRRWPISCATAWPRISPRVAAPSRLSCSTRLMITVARNPPLSATAAKPNPVNPKRFLVADPPSTILRTIVVGVRGCSQSVCFVSSAPETRQFNHADRILALLRIRVACVSISASCAAGTPE